tara:strand:+ start:68 stop:316 length:249 start_codon:yes stop_codon:yes gene_type:complete
MNVFEIPVVWETMNLYGIKVGNSIVVDVEEKPREGDVVMIKDMNSFNIFEYQPPYLIARSTYQTPNVDLGLVDIIGVVIPVK